MDTIELTYRFTGKEVDEETGLYYYGARYLDPRTSRWLSADPALGEYIPDAPVNEEAKKANQNLPGMGGVFNVVNFQLYHYAGNNPVKYVDPDGRFVFALPAIPALIDLGLKGLAILAAGAAGWKAGEKLAEAKADNDRRQAENAPSPVNQRSLSAEAGPGQNAIPEEDKDKIANGHALSKHGEKLGADDSDEVLDQINDVMESPWTEVKEGENDRTAYYNPETNTIVIHDPSHADKGTVFRPGKGREYFDDWN